MDEIRRTEKALSSEILDKTIQNTKAKDNLLVCLMPVTSALFTYARQINDISLREKTRYTQSHFVRCLESDLVNKAEIIRTLAERNLAQLKKYGIGTRELDALMSATASFRNTLANKVSSLISSDTVMLMNDRFNNADNLLTQMDVFVEALPDEYEEFYDEYIFARDLENQDQVKAMMELEEEEEEGE